jgi:glycosyltransferase involved in cell wall biosynthesis
MTLVTVLMPVYNGERFLREAVASVLSQTHRDLELLIIDDGSTDSTAEILNSYRDSRIRVVRNNTNLKLIRTLNKGLDLASGSFVARMDADDVCFPKRIERQLDWFTRYPELEACGAFAIRIDEAGRHGALMKRPTGERANMEVWFPTPIIHPTAMIRSETAKKFLYDESCLHCEDYDLWIRMATNGLKIGNYPRPLLYYRVHGSGISQVHRELQLRNSFLVFQKYFGQVALTLDEFKALIGVGNSLSLRKRMQLLKKLDAGPDQYLMQLFLQGRAWIHQPA